MQMIQLANPMGNTSGAMAGIGQQQEAIRQQNIGSTANFARDALGSLTGALMDKFGGGGPEPLPASFSQDIQPLDAPDSLVNVQDLITSNPFPTEGGV